MLCCRHRLTTGPRPHSHTGAITWMPSPQLITWGYSWAPFSPNLFLFLFSSAIPRLISGSSDFTAWFVNITVCSCCSEYYNVVSPASQWLVIRGRWCCSERIARSVWRWWWGKDGTVFVPSPLTCVCMLACVSQVEAKLKACAAHIHVQLKAPPLRLGRNSCGDSMLSVLFSCCSGGCGSSPLGGLHPFRCTQNTQRYAL